MAYSEYLGQIHMLPEDQGNQFRQHNRSDNVMSSKKPQTQVEEKPADSPTGENQDSPTTTGSPTAETPSSDGLGNGRMTGLALSVPPATSVLAPLTELAEIPQRVATMLPVGTVAEREFAYSCQTGEDKEADEMLRAPFMLKNWLMHDASKTDPATGEVIQFVRIVMVTEDGLRISTTSNSIRRNLLELIRFRGPAPWSPPIKVKIMPKKGSQPGPYFILEIVRGEKT